MTRIEGEVLIRRPVGEILDVVADERTEPPYGVNLISLKGRPLERWRHVLAARVVR
jgi:hypothetical protein